MFGYIYIINKQPCFCKGLPLLGIRLYFRVVRHNLVNKLTSVVHASQGQIQDFF